MVRSGECAWIVLTAVVGTVGCISGGGDQPTPDGGLDATTDAGEASADSGGCDGSSCGSACVDLQNDAQNCGACGHACGTGFQCLAGKCGDDVTDIVAGSSDGCVLYRDQRVACWGLNTAGQTGTDPSNADDKCGISDCRTTPTIVKGLDGIVQLSYGIDFGCAVRNDGAVLCWGQNATGQLARPLSTPYSATPAAIALPVGKKGAQVTCGQNSACVRTLSNEVFCWGANQWSEVGSTATSTPITTPTQVAFDKADVVAVAMSNDAGSRQHACAIRADKSVWCWGSNLNYELGHAYGSSGDVTCSDGTYSGACNPTPVAVSGIGGVTSLAVGPGTSSAIGSDGVMGWGGNAFDTLSATGSATASPVPVEGLAGADAGAAAIVALSPSMAYDEIGLDGSGNAWAWGRNYLGELGTGVVDGTACHNGTGNHCVAPTKILGNVARVSAGYYFSMALTTDGKVLAWGANDNATLAHLPNATGSGDQSCNGSNVCNPTPKPITNLP